jgi:hypothetical protein
MAEEERVKLMVVVVVVVDDDERCCVARVREVNESPSYAAISTRQDRSRENNVLGSQKMSVAPSNKALNVGS